MNIAKPELIELLELVGYIFTIDAIGCQAEIAAKIIDRQAEYVLAVKDNQPHLREDIAYILKLCLQQENPLQYLDDYHKTVEKDHGRIETCECYALSASGHEQSVRGATNWPHLNSYVCAINKRRIADKIERETRYFISSLPPIRQTPGGYLGSFGD